MWFNPDDLLTPAADPEIQIRKFAGLAETNNLTVTCYTPNGNPIEVEARDQAHAEQLRRWNPEPTKH